jgi:hypothetical protein
MDSLVIDLTKGNTSPNTSACQLKTPKFQFKRRALAGIVSKSRLKRVWTEKVRAAMKDQAVPDSVEYLDIHADIDRVCRILVEKSKGLCRLMVIPCFRDAILLESLSEAFWERVKSKAPTPNAFFEPEDHRFRKKDDDDYGPVHAWLNFQKKILNFSKTRKYIVVTDIANYYDFISYSHLRNVISSITRIEESILDCLIYILSDLLWQPDYMPKYFIGLPQMNINAPRLLAHCFLYELDQVLSRYSRGDYVRYMDDIDVGVDTVADAKRYIRDIDLILQSRHLRLNSGKTKILDNREARTHFKIIENRVLDKVEDNIDRGLYPLALRPGILLRLHGCWSKKKTFDIGNGEKILKRLLRLCREWGAFIGDDAVCEILALRPSVRGSVLRYRSHFDYSDYFIDRIISYISSDQVVDQVTYIDIAKCIVEMRVSFSAATATKIKALIRELSTREYYGAIAALWMLSKYGEAEEIYRHIRDKCLPWKDDVLMARMIVGMAPRLKNSKYHNLLLLLITKNYIKEADGVFEFHRLLGSDPNPSKKVIDVVCAPNTSSPCRISHSKFLIILSLANNSSLTHGNISRLKKRHSFSAVDGFYASLMPKSW